MLRGAVGGPTFDKAHIRGGQSKVDNNNQRHCGFESD